MSRKAAASAIELIRRRTAAKFSHELGTFTHPLPFFRSNLHTLDHKDRRDSSKPKVDFRFSSVKDVDDAIFLFREIERMQPQPSVLVYNNLLSVIVKMKHHSVALSVFDKMRQMGAPVNEFTFSIAINCYCLVSRVDFGLSILGIIFKRGYEPDVTTFTTLLKGQFLDHKVAEAEKLFKKLLVLKLCEPNDVMILTIINGLCKDGLCKDGKLEVARDLCNELPSTGLQPTVRIYTYILGSLCQEGPVEEAKLLLVKMEENGCPPDICSYNVIVQSLLRRNELFEAIPFLEEMCERGFSPMPLPCPC